MMTDLRSGGVSPARAKRRARAEKALGALTRKHGKGACWVCRSTSGLKTARAAFGTRCRRCIALGKTTPDVELYEQLKKELET